MNFLRNAPIKRKLYAIIMGTVTVTLLLSLGLSLAVQIGVARDEAENQLRSLAKVLGASSQATVAFRDPQAARDVLATLHSHGDVLWAYIRLEDDREFARYLAPGVTLPFPYNDLGNPFRPIVVEEPILVDGKTVAHLWIAGNLERVRDVLIRQSVPVLAVFALSLLLALVLSSRLQRIVSVPVQNLLEAMRDVGARRDFERKAERLGDDELGGLTDGFNEMLSRIEAYDRQLAQYRRGLETQVDLRTMELEKATQRAIAASKAKSEFLATMSHEIRTPMTGVVGFTRLLEQTQLDDEQQEFVKIIKNSAGSLLQIIDEILDFSKMEAGKAQLEMRAFEVAELVDAVRLTLTPKAIEKGLAFDISCASEVPPVLYGDSARVGQILTNLAGNAVKFTEQGRIDVSLEVAERGTKHIDLQIIVTDTGIGIGLDEQARLFQPFQQGDSSITRRFGGTGLGLVIVKRLTDLMEGAVGVSSAAGEGSTFTATVRLGVPGGASLDEEGIAAESGNQDEALAAAPLLSGLRILVVDDSPINLRLARTLLDGAGAHTVAVENAAQALAAVKSAPFDLILMDLEMPDMSGIEASRRIRRLLPSTAAAMPIIAITAHAFREKRRQVQDAGMNDLLAKPYLPRQLIEMVRRWTDTEDPQTPDEKPGHRRPGPGA